MKIMLLTSAAVHRVCYAGDDGTDAIGLTVPEMVFLGFRCPVHMINA